MANYLTYDDALSLFGKIGEVLSQKATLPTAAQSLLGKIYQYIGTTGNGLVNGRFYKCVGNGDPVVYSWVEIKISDASEDVYRTLASKQDLMVITTDFDLDYKTSDGQVIIWGGNETSYKKGRLYLVSVDSQTGVRTLTELSTLTTTEKTKFDSLSPILQTATLTLAATDWMVETITNDLTNTTTTSLPYQSITLYPTYNLKYNNRNVIDITLGEEQDWAENNVRCGGGLPITVNGIAYLQNVRFQADTVPSKNLTFRVTSMEVS